MYILDTKNAWIFNTFEWVFFSLITHYIRALLENID